MLILRLWKERQIFKIPSKSNCLALFVSLKDQLFLTIDRAEPQSSYSVYKIQGSLVKKLQDPVFFTLPYRETEVPKKLNFLFHKNSEQITLRTGVTIPSFEKVLFQRQQHEIGRDQNRVYYREKTYETNDSDIVVLSKKGTGCIDTKTYFPIPNSQSIDRIAILGDTLFAIRKGEILMFDTKTDSYLSPFEETKTHFQDFNVDEEEGILYATTSEAIISYSFVGKKQVKENKIIKLTQAITKLALHFLKNIFKEMLLKIAMIAFTAYLIARSNGSV